MKLLKIFLILSLCFLFSQENQQKRTLKDFFENWSLGINTHIGQISPITSSDRAAFNPGHSIGISLQAPKPLTLFKQKFIYGVGLNSSSLNGNTKKTRTINTISFDMVTKFKKLPLDFKFGFGISDLGVSGGGIAGSGILDIMHDLSDEKVDKVDFSIGIRFQQIFDITKNYKVSHLHGLYGLNINIGKSITF